MADQTLTSRTESTDTSTELQVHVVQGGLSYRQTRTNLLKPVTDVIAALPAWQTDITGVSLIAGNNNVDTSQATREPKDWKILDGSLSNTPDITSEFVVGTIQSTNWFITINTPIVRSNLIVRWFGIVILLFLFGVSTGQDLMPIANGWKNLGKSNFLDSVIVQNSQSEGIPFFVGELLKTSSGLTYNTAASSLYLSTTGQLRFGSANDRIYLLNGTALYLATDDQVYLICDSVYVNNPSGNTNALRVGTLALRNEGTSYAEILSPNKLYIKSNDTLFLKEKDGSDLVVCVNDTCFYVNDILGGSGVGSSSDTEILFNNAGVVDGSPNLIWDDSLMLYSTSTVLNPNVSSSSSAIAYKFNTQNNITNSGAKLFSLQNNDVEKLSVDIDGKLSCFNFTATSSFAGNLFSGSLPSAGASNGLTIGTTIATDNKTGAYIYMNDLSNHGAYNVGGYWVRIVDNTTTTGTKNRVLLLNSIDGTDRTSLNPRASGTSYSYIFDAVNDIDSIFDVRKQGLSIFKIKDTGVEVTGTHVSTNPYFYAACSDSAILVDITQNVYSSFGDSSMTQYVNEGGFVFQGDSVQIPVTGRYYVQFEVDFQGTATTSSWDGHYTVNGVIIANRGGLSRTTSTNVIWSANMTTVLSLTAGDWIKPKITNTANGNDLTLINLDLIIKWDD